MKRLTTLCVMAILMASCSNGSSGSQDQSDSTTNLINSDTAGKSMTNPENMAGGNATDTNGHILNNGKVRMGNDKVINGDVNLDSTK